MELGECNIIVQAEPVQFLVPASVEVRHKISKLHYFSRIIVFLNSPQCSRAGVSKVCFLLYSYTRACTVMANIFHSSLHQCKTSQTKRSRDPFSLYSSRSLFGFRWTLRFVLDASLSPICPRKRVWTASWTSWRFISPSRKTEEARWRK